jgi:hypothetical protein
MSDLVEYPPGSGFPGVIGRTVQESSPAWPAPARAREGAPSVLFFVLDDIGYGQLSCFGGLVETPNIDRVAASGLRYANTVAAQPTRSSSRGRPTESRDVAAEHPEVMRDLVARCPHTTPLFFELEGVSCGFDFGAPATEYDPPFPFTGTIRQVAVDLAGELIKDDEAELRLLMARQ